MQISKQQIDKLIQYMSNNLEFNGGQFDGNNSNANSKEQYEMLKFVKPPWWQHQVCRTMERGMYTSFSN